MDHSHYIFDTDVHFVIDPITRRITSESGKVILIRYDHNSERFTFEIPRYVEGHDMSLATEVQIHYINTNGNSKNIAHSDVYIVDDVQAFSYDNSVTFSWLLSHNTTKFAGALKFVVRFVCTEDDEIVYQWSTDIYDSIKVIDTIHNIMDYTENNNPDILEKWKAEILREIDEGGILDKWKEEILQEIGEGDESEEDLDEYLANYLQEHLSNYLTKRSGSEAPTSVEFIKPGYVFTVKNAKTEANGGAYVMNLMSPIAGKAMVSCFGKNNESLGSYGFDAADKFVIWGLDGNSLEVLHLGNIDAVIKPILDRIAALEENGVSSDILSPEGVEF